MVQKAYLIRYEQNKCCTFGFIVAGDSSFHTLELPYRDNKKNQSCIPKGSYPCNYLPRSASGKYRSVYHVRNVQDRSGILIHAGNVPDQTKGCVLIGKRRGWLAGVPAVLNSRSALNDFVDLMDDKFELEVISWIG